MPNPTVQDFVDAYETTGMKPITGDYISDDGTCGCAVGVYAIAQGMKDEEDIIDWLEVQSKGSVGNSSFFTGVIYGFDGINMRVESAELVEGYAVGEQVRKIMLGEEDDV